MWIKTLYEGCLDVLFPRRCGVCAACLTEESFRTICSACLSRIRFLQEPICAICGIEVYAAGADQPICGDCLRKPPPFQLARSLFYYDDDMRHLISRLKYHKDMSVLPCLDDLIHLANLSLFDSCDYYVPVPLHRKRLQQRGFNQALWLTRLCFGESNPRINTNVLRRTINTAPQVTLNGRERRKGLKKAFSCNAKIDISGATICLVDDVYTTGTTVSECSRELIEAGAEKVVVLTLARVAVPQRGRGGN